MPVSPQETLTRPILYSFRRCPYAMRARLGIWASGLEVELREIVLRDKAPAFLQTSPTATVPCLVKPDGQVVDESLDIMLWALKEADPEHWLSPKQGSLADILEMIAQNDGPFKKALDRYKYDTRFPDADRFEEREKASLVLRDYDRRLKDHAWLMGDRPSLADYALLPFVRQFANVDREWFDAESWPALLKWLGTFEKSEVFANIMPKFLKWEEGQETLLFGRHILR